MREPISFMPGLTTSDPLAGYWLGQATLRLRREICWLQYERGQTPGSEHASLPRYSDRLMETLDMARFREEKQRFFAEDRTAAWLSERLREPEPGSLKPARGSFSWVVSALELDEAARFALALGLLVAFDNAAGNVIAAVLNDAHRTLPTLALLQRLWDRPEQVLPLASAAHPLWSHGLLQQGRTDHQALLDWEKAFAVPTIAARALLFADSGRPHGLNPIAPLETKLATPAEQLAVAALERPPGGLRILPILGASDVRETAARIAHLRQRGVVEPMPGHFTELGQRNALAAYAWLMDLDLLVRWDDDSPAGHDHGANPVLPDPTIPVTVYLAIKNAATLKKLPRRSVLPPLSAPNLTFAERYHCWLQALDGRAAGLEPHIAETARRFRIGRSDINRIARRLLGLPGKLTAAGLTGACRAAFEPDMGHSAQKVAPRFEDETLVLPPKQERQFREVEQAMRSLTQVHYGWGAAKAWNEGGIAVLFGGPPGTGKTMGAEVLAARLDLPMYRIDLSQIVSKYIGETEKNLSAVFDAADASDLILFFDEADALFGKRSEVKDSHDRYANLEISYLLERMERFKGLAILATNRKKDLDEAFLRRLRFIIDFPLPGEAERECIWRQVIPNGVGVEGVDFPWLARQFALAGGHIRSIAFNACLQAAGDGVYIPGQPPGSLTMEQILIAVKREYQKLDRTISRDRFGAYAPLIGQLEQDHAS